MPQRKKDVLLDLVPTNFLHLYSSYNFRREDYDGHFQMPVNKILLSMLNCFSFYHYPFGAVSLNTFFHSHVIVDVIAPSM